MNLHKVHIVAYLGVFLLAVGIVGGCSQKAQDSAPPPVAGSDKMPPEALAAKERADTMHKARAEAQGRAMQQSQQSAPK